MLSLVIAKMHANIAGYDAAVMLDDRGFVAELNDTNLFMVKKNKVTHPFLMLAFQVLLEEHLWKF